MRGCSLDIPFRCARRSGGHQAAGRLQPHGDRSAGRRAGVHLQLQVQGPGANTSTGLTLPLRPPAVCAQKCTKVHLHARAVLLVDQSLSLRSVVLRQVTASFVGKGGVANLKPYIVAGSNRVVLTLLNNRWGVGLRVLAARPACHA